MSEQSAWICGTGMVTPVGDCTAQTAASVRAGISAYQESGIHNKRLDAMTMALLPDEALPELKEEVAAYPKLTARQARMLRLGQPALLEALTALPDDQKVPLFLAGPETLPGQPLAISEVFLNLLITQTEVNLDRSKSALLNSGRAGGMQALQAALNYLAGDQQGFALIGGVDSYLDLYLLASLDRDNRVLANDIMDGFAPGEGAAFLLLCSDKSRESLVERPCIKIHRPGIANEKGHRFSQETYTGDGLANAVTSAVAVLDNDPVRTILSSMNGEHMGAKEWGVAYTRNSSAIAPDFRFEHPADCLGDTGAAIMPILTGIAATGLKKGYLTGPVLSNCSSEGPPRGAVCITIEA